MFYNNPNLQFNILNSETNTAELTDNIPVNFLTYCTQLVNARLMFYNCWQKLKFDDNEIKKEEIKHFLPDGI